MIFQLVSFFHFLFKNLVLAGIVCTLSSHLLAYPLIGIRINGGDQYTNAREVTLEIKSLKIEEKLVKSMQIAHQPSMNESEWIPYSGKPFSFSLPSGDGSKTIHVRLKDKNGNISPVETAQIILDTRAPLANKVLINKGAEYTNNPQMKVMLTLDAEGADKMQVSNHNNFEEADWEIYKPQKIWLLAPPGDGEKTVYARFIDEANNVSEVIQSSIVLDTQAPSNCSVVINEDQKYTNQTQVKLQIKASGASKVRLLDRSGKEEILNFDIAKGEATVDWSFDNRPGIKAVRAYFIDEAKNYSKNTIQDEIILDQQPPAPPLLRINNGKDYTNNSEGLVDLHISSRESPVDLTMYIANSKNSEPQPSAFKNIVPDWQLPAAEDGDKSIFVRLEDEAGNISDYTRASIILDRQPPQVATILINDGDSVTNNPEVQINIEADGADFMQIAANKNILKSNNWQPFSTSISSFQLPVGDGLKKLYFVFRDKAGNTSYISTASIRLDKSAPQGLLAFVKDQRFTNEREVAVKFKTGDAKFYQISHRPDFRDSKWRPATESTYTYTLPDEDGSYKLYFRLKDAIGNLSKPSSIPVELDRKPPTNVNIQINNGATWFNRIDMKVSISLQATGAEEVMISNSESFEQGKWVAMQRTIGWLLNAKKDGEKTVYAKFRDKAGNESQVATAKINVDTGAPLAKNFEINKGASFTNALDRKVKLTIDAEGADSLLLSNEPIDTKSPLKWIAYRDTLTWQLMDQDGVLTVYGILKDKAGNTSTVFNDHIILDRVPPEFTRVFIQNNARFTNTPQVHVRLIAREAVKMKVSNYPKRDTVAWMPYTNLIENWTLDTAREGRKMVFAWFMDKAGNVSDAIADDIILDRIAPADISVGYRNDSLSNQEAWIVIKATDPKTMQWSFGESLDEESWQKYEPEFKVKLPQNKDTINFRIRFRDEAENTTQVFNKLIIKKEKVEKQEFSNE